MAKFVKIQAQVTRPAGRALSEAQLQPDPALIAEGWVRRFTADSQRADEAIELYAKLGYEVRAEPSWADETMDECDSCHSVASAEFKTIYTRKLKD